MTALMSDPNLLQGSINNSVQDTMNPSTATNMLPYYGYYNNNSMLDSDPNQDQRAQDFLKAYQKYDPNAHFESEGSYGGEGGGGTPYWKFVGDSSKLPGSGPTGMDKNPGDFNSLRGTHIGETLVGPSQTNGASEYTPIQPGVTNKLSSVDTTNMVNPRDLYGDNTYGYQTDPNNIKVDHSIWDTLGPALPLIFGTIMSGGAMSPLLSAAMKVPQELDSISHNGFNPMSIAGTAASMIPGVNQVMPYLNAASSAYQLSRGNLSPLFTLGGHLLSGH